MEKGHHEISALLNPFRRYQHEPIKLWRYCMVSFSMMLCCWVAIVAVAYQANMLTGKLVITDESRQDYSSKQIKKYEPGNSRFQFADRRSIIARTNEDLITSKSRLSIIQKMLTDNDSIYFTDAWRLIETERAKQKELRERLEYYEVKPLLNSVYFSSSAMFFIATILAFFCGRLLLLHAVKAGPGKVTDSDQWIWAYLFMGFSNFFGLLFPLLYTNLVRKEAIWLGFTSLCINRSSFLLQCLSYLFYCFVITAPLSMMWCLCDSERIPFPKANNPESDKKAHDYVRFVKTWILLGLIITFSISYSWVLFLKGCPPIYLLAVVTYYASVVAIIGRLVWNVYLLHLRYDRLNKSNGGAGSEKDPIMPFEDPTVDILGEKKLTIPGLIALSGANLWSLLEVVRNLV